MDQKKIDPQLGDTTIRYEGRTLRLLVLINTDQPVEWVVSALNRAVKSLPGAPMISITGGIMPPEDAKPIWEGVTAIAEAGVGRRN